MLSNDKKKKKKTLHKRITKIVYKSHAMSKVHMTHLGLFMVLLLCFLVIFWQGRNHVLNIGAGQRFFIVVVLRGGIKYVKNVKQLSNITLLCSIQKK